MYIGGPKSNQLRKERFPRFDFEDPSEAYGLIVQSSKYAHHSESVHNSSSESIQSILPIIKQKKAHRSQSKEVIVEDSNVVLVGNTFKRLQKHVLKPKIAYHPEIILPLKRLKKITLARPKFNGIYFDDERYSQDLDFQHKYASLKTYLNSVNLSNQLFVTSQLNHYKAYIGKGNNGHLVKQILKSRWWWQIIESDKESANLLWQQLRNNSYVIQLQPSSTQVWSSQADFPTQNEVLPYFKLLPAYLQFSLKDTITQPPSKSSKIITPDQARQYCKNLRMLEVTSATKMHNHVQNNMHLGSKKHLFLNMKKYYEAQNSNVFNYLPLTYLIRSPQELDKFLKDNFGGSEIWIIKPGELTNRGHGIQICSDLREIQSLLRGQHLHKNGCAKSFIIQRYIERPLLYYNRKFDIRCYILFTSINGQQKGYWYQEGYVRTSSKEFSLKNLTNKMVHLTNDAVQKNSEDYGKYEKGNKISFEEFARWLQVDFNTVIYPQIRSIAIDQFQAVYGKIDPHRRENAFELFGIDYMIDENYKVWLIETNTNPCLETTGPLLSRLIPQLLDNLLKLVVDPLFPPPPIYGPKKLAYESLENRFELVFEGGSNSETLSSVDIDDNL